MRCRSMSHFLDPFWSKGIGCGSTRSMKGHWFFFGFFGFFACLGLTLQGHSFH